MLEQTFGNRLRKEHVGRERHKDLSGEEVHVAQLGRANPSRRHGELPKWLVAGWNMEPDR